MILFSVLVVVYFLLGFYICGEAFERTKQAQDLNASLVEELTGVRKELVKAHKAIDGVKP
jgi:hypothetical protein